MNVQKKCKSSCVEFGKVCQEMCNVCVYDLLKRILDVERSGKNNGSSSNCVEAVESFVRTPVSWSYFSWQRDETCVFVCCRRVCPVGA